MFFCRHQLLRVPAQRHFSNLLAQRHATRLPVPKTHSRRHARPASSGSTAQDAPTDTTTTPTANDPTITTYASETLPHTDHGPAHEGERLSQISDEEFNLRPISNYIFLRKQHFSGLMQLTTDRVEAVIHNVLKGRWSGPDIVSNLVQDAIAICERQSSLRGRFIIVLLLRKLSIARALTKNQILQLLRTLAAHDGLRFVPEQSRVFIARAVAAYPPDRDLDGELFCMLAPWLTEALPGQPVPSEDMPSSLWEESSSGVLVPRVLWATFRGILALAQDGKQSEASALLAQLVSGEHLSNDAINATDLSSKDYVYIVLSVLVRTCLAHGWSARASELLMPEVSARRVISYPVAQLIEDWVATTLNDPHEEDLRTAASTFLLLFQRAEGFTVSEPVLQAFYDAAMHVKLPELVEVVYRATWKVKATHSYPPPRGKAILSFMQYLQQNSRNVHLARLLVQQVAEEDVPLPPPVRADFIGNAAALGFTLHARALWERYSTGPDRLAVVGRRAVMLRLVSAFVKAEAIALRTVRNRWPDEPIPELPRRNHVDDADAEAASGPGDQDEDGVGASPDGEEDRPHTMALHTPLRCRLRPHPRTETSRLRLRESIAESWTAGDSRAGRGSRDHHISLSQGAHDGAPHPSSLSPSPPPPHGDVKVASGLPPDDPAPEPGAEEGEDGGSTRPRRALGFDGLTRAELLERAGELRRFAETVFDAYVASKQPLETANHYGLNALARGAFMLGREELAFSVFATMKARRIKLDMYDVNVALSVVAKANPAAGAARIHGLVEAGFTPDAVTFGTVIHWAIFHGDAPLVGELLRHARATGLKRFSFKTMGSLLRGTVSGRSSSLATAGVQLDNARDIVDTMIDAGIRPTANMGRDCIVAALRAEDPAMAFRFWKHLVKGKVQFKDPAQAALRRRIARQVRGHYEYGWLDDRRAMAMLSELGLLPGMALARHLARKRFRATGGTDEDFGYAGDAR
ncbi:hypothetical protein GSI_15607 [Ganoderma sinense ZZ0214-1]|uniref:Pentacotripeptide-repeat region of PRORP domain-containing protein n=1 Tax=Ganoderma sinense ZZ0214-1 TaxID=1077348 RepID=A0A2G8RN33_9APHY|nr:hypothetical protein GSI_15607 [Ganoderma sinense ZZ0214-1]